MLTWLGRFPLHLPQILPHESLTLLLKRKYPLQACVRTRASILRNARARRTTLLFHTYEVVYPKYLLACAQIQLFYCHHFNRDMTSFRSSANSAVSVSTSLRSKSIRTTEETPLIRIFSGQISPCKIPLVWIAVRLLVRDSDQGTRRRTQPVTAPTPAP
jgi:hypothetical protein